MAGEFDFLRKKFPDLADDGAKAESYINSDNEACVFFISRAFSRALRHICSFNGITAVNNSSLERADNVDIINLLRGRGIIDLRIYCILDNLRRFRNANSHTEDNTKTDSLFLMEQLRMLCECLMEKYGGGLAGLPLKLKRDDFVDSGGTVSVREIKEFISSGINVNTVHSLSGRTVLITAVIGGNAEAVRYLLEHGADIKIKDKYGHNATDYAVSHKVQKLFAACGVQFKAEAKPAAKKDKKGLKPDDFVNSGVNISVRKIQEYISAGVNVNSRHSKSGRTVLISAAIVGNIEGIAYLLEHGADPNITDKAGHNALYYAEQNPKLKKSSVMQKLTPRVSLWSRLFG